MSPPASFEEKLPLLQGDCENDKPEEVTCRYVPARYVVAGLGFLGFFILRSLRAGVSVALVAMVNSSSLIDAEPEGGYNGSDNNGQASSGTPQGEFDWDETTQGLVLAAFYYGYAFFQPFGGSVAIRLGGKNTFAIGLFCYATLSLLLPVAARAHVGYFIAIRIVQGMAEAMASPSMNTLWAVWAPPRERGRLVNFTLAATEIGAVLGMLTSGLLIQNGFLGGWPSVFYINGMLGCVWTLLWVLLIHETPDKHPRLTSKERALFVKRDISKKVLNIPWRHIATSPAVWAIAVNHFMIGWDFNSLSSMLPTYMSNIQHFDIEQNGILSSVPFLAQYLFETVGSFLLDLLRSGRYITTQTSRKLLDGVGGVMAAASFLAMGFVPEGYPTLAVIMITLAMGWSGLCVCCVRVSHLDIAPRFAGTLYGLTNTLSACAGFIAPAVIAALLEQGQTIEQWRIYFFMTAAIYFVAPTIFCVFGKGEELPWAKVNSYERIVDVDHNSTDDDRRPLSMSNGIHDDQEKTYRSTDGIVSLGAASSSSKN